MTNRGAIALTALAVAISACGSGNAAPSPVPATNVASPGTATLATSPTQAISEVDGLSVTTVPLGAGDAPIDVVSAFGSLWIAAHRKNTVVRLDPATLQPIARIQVGGGPGWFAITDDALWVTNQMGLGLTRIDPSTNTADVRAGSWPTCGWPAVLSGSIWEMSCDTGRIMRIDPKAYADTDIDASGFTGLGVVGDRLVAVGPDALYELDPESSQLTKLEAIPSGFPVGFDDSSVWVAAEDGIHRIAVEDGSELGMLPIGADMNLTFASSRAWLTVFGTVVHEIDMSTTSITRTLHLDSPAVAREIDGVVWVTGFDGDSLSHFVP